MFPFEPPIVDKGNVCITAMHWAEVREYVDLQSRVKGVTLKPATGGRFKTDLCICFPYAYFTPNRPVISL